MKKAQWGFSFKKSKKYFLKQLCLYFIFEVNGIKKIYLPFKKTEFFLHIFKTKNKSSKNINYEVTHIYKSS
jgi:hypothetical protein